MQHQRGRRDATERSHATRGGLNGDELAREPIGAMAAAHQRPTLACSSASVGG